MVSAAGEKRPPDRGEAVGLGYDGQARGLIMPRLVPSLPAEPPSGDSDSANGWEVVNLNSLLRSLAPILRQVAGNKVALELRLASDLGQTRITLTQFQQALLKLCVHAKKIMPAGRYIALTISDPAQGLTPGVVENLLEFIYTGSDRGAKPAHRYQHVYRTKAELAVVLYLPETMEAEVTARSRLARSPLARGPETLLIIEADAALRKMITGLLTIDGYQVSAVATAAEARGQLAGQRPLPQLVLMSGGSQAETKFVRQLLAANKQLRIINTSAEYPWRGLTDIPEQRRRHLPKPFALSILLAQIRVLLDAPT